MLHWLRCKATARSKIKLSTYAFSRLVSSTQSHNEAELQKLLTDLQGRPGATTFGRVLQLCAKLGSLQQGKEIHAEIIRNKMQSYIFLGNHLINMYGKCQCPDEARRTFDSMVGWNVFSWTSMIGAYVSAERFDDAFLLFRLMQLSGTRPDEVTYVTMLNACTRADECEFLCSCIAESGLRSNPIIANAMVNMYGKCGDLQVAWEFFEGIPEGERDVVCWTSLLSAFAQNGDSRAAFKHFRYMQLQGVKPNSYTLSTMLTACDSLSQVKHVHFLIDTEDCGLDVVLGNGLVNSYGKFGYVKDAQRVFDKMPEKDIISWNSMMGCYALDEWNHTEAHKLYKLMQLEGEKPNKVAFMTALETCSNLTEANAVHHAIVESGMEGNPMLGTTILDMYSKFGKLESAKEAFVKLDRADVVAWNAVIAAYAQNGHPDGAVEMFRKMQLEGTKPVTSLTFLPILNVVSSLNDVNVFHEWVRESGCDIDEAVTTSLMSMHSRCGKLQQAQEMFEKLSKSSPSAWNAVIAANAQNENSEESLMLFKRMHLDGVKPDRITFIHITNACWNCGAHVLEMRCVESLATSAGFELDLMVMTSLVSMFGKCGHVEDAWRVFLKMEEHNIVSWNSMVAAYAQHGHTEKALQLVRKMQQEGFKADDITLTSALSACSHAGLSDDARWYFASMVSEYGIRPTSQHYSCMVDVLARAGQLDKLKDFIRRMKGSELDVVAWTALLSACWSQSDVELAMIACDEILKMDPQQSSAVVMLYNAHKTEFDRKMELTECA